MSDDEKAIRALIAAWMDASKNGDIDTVLGLMTDDVVFMTPGREPFGKQAYAEQSRAMIQSGMKLDGESEIVELQVLGGWAWLRNHLRVTVSSPGKAPVQRQGHVLTLLRKNAQGRWQLARDANLLD
ncbi:MAG: Ketosteroid isomerase [Betaproteobacteria bacterium]|nr:Ketosteroid isomerase [Betaproteobacteria bacterium]